MASEAQADSLGIEFTQITNQLSGVWLLAAPLARSLSAKGRQCSSEGDLTAIDDALSCQPKHSAHARRDCTRTLDMCQIARVHRVRKIDASLCSWVVWVLVGRGGLARAVWQHRLRLPFAVTMLAK